MKSLSKKQLSDFIEQGYVKIEHAFSEDVAAACRAYLWKATGCNPTDPDTWTEPVIRINELGFAPFKEAANTSMLHNAFDQLVGKGNWIPRTTLGSFPVRFPSKRPAGDTGWHVDASFPGNNPDNYIEWRINVCSKGRALLMLFLFSDVTDDDAPTRLKIGSHNDVAKILQPYGEEGLSFMQMAEQLDTLPAHKEALATGKAGTVYLCHPFIVHAAQDHHGTVPKFMAQPPLITAKDFDITKPENELCAVEKAIARALRNR